ncbi:MAG TPA: EamA family transporter [Polyangia bacterium]|nr:EamA family transporter [Polyangia bacterium]
MRVTAGAGPAPSRAALLVAFATLYVIWGSTYLAIRVAVVSWPPLILAAVRFTLAGAGLYAWLRVRGAPRPTRREWGGAAVIGTLLLGGGNGLVCWAEQWVPSGEAALIVASVPLWMTALPWMLGRARMPHPLALAGVALGLAGVGLLVGSAAPRAQTVAAGHALLGGRVALLLASLSWSVGSLVASSLASSAPGSQARRLALPRQPAMASALEMLAAGPIIAAGAAVKGEWGDFHLAAVSGSGWTALVYLIVFGSFAGFGSYVYLLKHASPARVSTYAFVNPLVAVLLGTFFAHEALAARTLAAAALIVCAVAAVVLGTAGRRAGPPQPDN